jgi:pimeloyl-ACP methyl ester carboxylesterase
MAYAPVNGLQLYYEVRGSGQPLVPLHGGLQGHRPNICSSAVAGDGERHRSDYPFWRVALPAPNNTSRLRTLAAAGNGFGRRRCGGVWMSK